MRCLLSVSQLGSESVRASDILQGLYNEGMVTGPERIWHCLVRLAV